jgi:hypothetical protein
MINIINKPRKYNNFQLKNHIENKYNLYSFYSTNIHHYQFIHFLY